MRQLLLGNVRKIHCNQSNREESRREIEKAVILMTTKDADSGEKHK